MEKSELIKLIKKQSQRLYDLVDCGYAEAFTKAIGGSPLDSKELKIIELYKNETEELLRLTADLEKL